jgi:uncharacterized protein
MSATDPIETETAAPMITLAGEALFPDRSGALLWPAAETVIVADLHLEKGTSYGPQGVTLPPYDTAATIASLSDVLKRRRPERVICLGDSFHDNEAGERIDPADRVALSILVAAHRWFWIAGNHDPHPPKFGGSVIDELAIGRLAFRHEAQRAAAVGEVSGHYHPKSSYRAHGRSVGGRCFVGDSRRLILPAFGAFAGGLDVRDLAIARLFPQGCEVHLIARGRVTRLPRG